MSRRTLVTGFGPFLDIAENPSSQLAASLGRPYRVIEVSYRAAEEFIREIDRNSFDRLLLMGVAGRRGCLSAELVAHNIYGSTADVSGGERSGRIRPTGPELLRSTLFVREELSPFLGPVSELRLSTDAGTYLCNFIYFLALEAFPEKHVGFLHVPKFDRVAFEVQRAIVGRLLSVLEGRASTVSSSQT